MGDNKAFKDMDFNERVKWATAESFDALIRGGTREMQANMWGVLNTFVREAYERGKNDAFEALGKKVENSGR